MASLPARLLRDVGRGGSPGVRKLPGSRFQDPAQSRVSSDAAWAACLHEKRLHERVDLIPIKRHALAVHPTDRRCQAVSTNSGAVRAGQETKEKRPCCTRPAKRASRHEQAHTSQSLPACSRLSRTDQHSWGDRHSRSSHQPACVRQAAGPHGLLPRLSGSEGLQHRVC